MFFHVLMRARLQLGAVIVMLALPSAQAQPEARLRNAKLGVEGTAFVLRLPDGRVLKSGELQGATVQVASGDGPGHPAAPQEHPAGPERPRNFALRIKAQSR